MHGYYSSMKLKFNNCPNKKTVFNIRANYRRNETNISNRGLAINWGRDRDRSQGLNLV